MTNEIISGEVVPEAVMITDPAMIKEVAAIARIHRWKLTADAVIKFGQRPARGWTIKAFNAEYRQGTTYARSWRDVQSVCTQALDGIRADMGVPRLLDSGEMNR